MKAFGKAAYFGFFQIAQGEYGPLELVRFQAVEEITLVFIGVQAFEQIVDAVFYFFAGVMAGGNGVDTLLDGVVEKAFEFDFGIAQNIGIRRASGRVFFEKIGKDVVFVLGGKIDDVDVDADDVGDGNRIEGVLLDAAIFVGVVIFPVLHKDTAYLMALLVQQGGGYGGVDTAGESDDDVFRGVGGIHDGRYGAKTGNLKTDSSIFCIVTWLTDRHNKGKAV